MKMLFFGDSNTWGYDAKDASRQKNRFTQLIKERFNEHEIIEEGLCGRTICLDDPYDDDRNGAKMISMVLKTHAPIDVVFIMLGTNDAKRQFSTNSISLEKGIRTLLYKALNPEIYRDGSKVPQFFVVCPPKMNVDGLNNERTQTNFGQIGFEILNNSKPYLEKGCSGLGVDVIDTNVVAGNIDGIHMDESGHRQVADALISVIQEL
ncbi:GDSL-type esterase/lipase family protein [uncultured Holdemanella sp.]|uniref:GDSL-type esterase/lipase family protein n=1 Tax=uncultured Holdemanella sp. TaxID=1763549 RepID=UPI00258A0C03|nr:GDSL-type esterase/lipase family protein [uncultured Holdemanella sp.]